MIDAAGVILWLAVTAYAVFGGADYGAGFWVLVSPGDRGESARALVKHAVGPVWEVNHVWLIYSLILLWTAFPPAFGSLMSAMFTPLSLAIVGIVLRGSAFAFSGAAASARASSVWDRVYSVSSVITPFLLGAVLGGVASGRVSVGDPTGQPLDAWVNPTSVVVGLFAVAITAYLSAVFLTSDARRYGDEALEQYFRRRAVSAAAAAGVVALVGFFVLSEDAPFIRRGLTGEALPLVLASGVFGLAALVILRRGARRWTRILAVSAVASVVWAWGLAQYPYVLPTSLTLEAAAGSTETLQWVIFAFGLATVLVVPPLVLLYVLDQRGRLEEIVEPSE